MNLVRKVNLNDDNELTYILILAAVQFAHIVDFVVLMPLGPTLMKSLGITPIQFGSLVSSYNFAAGFAGIVFGSIADKYDRKSLLMFVLTGFIIGTFFCGVFDTFSLLLIFRVITGAFGGILTGVTYAIVADLIPIERRGKAMGIVMSAFSVSSVIGVPIGLAISDHYGWQYTFYFISLFTCFIWIGAQIYLPNVTAHLGKNSLKFFARFKSILLKKDYLRSFVFIFCTSGAVFLLIPYLSPYAVKNMGIKTEQLKWMYMVGGLFTIISARALGVLTDKVGAFKVFSTVVFISFIPIILFTHSGPISFGLYLALGSFFMTMVSGRMIPCMTLVSGVPDDSERGFFMSVLNSIRSCGSATLTFIAGFFISESSTGQLQGFNVTGYLSLGMGLLTVYLAAKIHRRLSDLNAQVRVESVSP